MNAYDATTGAFKGTLQDPSGNNIKLPGLWSLYVGNGGIGGDRDTVHFTARPKGQAHGVLGSISANPNLAASGISNAAQAEMTVAPKTFMTIKGSNLGATKRSVAIADIVTRVLPSSIDGVTVTLNGKPAFITYVSPVQINLVTPVDLPTSGSVTVVVSNNDLTSAALDVSAQFVAPALFLNGKYAASLHANNTIVGPTTLVANNSTPATPGETIVLFGAVFCVTTPAAVSGGVVSAPAPRGLTPAILFDNVSARVVFAGLIATGVYQINVVVPSGLRDGDVPVVASTAGYSSPALILTTIKN